MKTRSSLFMLFVVAVLVLAACGGGAPAEAPAEPELYREEATAPMAEEPAAPSADKAGNAISEQSVADSIGFPVDDNAAYEITNQAGDLTVLERSNRMIVKNADIRLLWKIRTQPLTVQRRSLEMQADTSSARAYGIRIMLNIN